MLPTEPRKQFRPGSLKARERAAFVAERAIWVVSAVLLSGVGVTAASVLLPAQTLSIFARETVRDIGVGVVVGGTVGVVLLVLQNARAYDDALRWMRLGVLVQASASSDLERVDFADMDLTGGLFRGKDMRGAFLQRANLTKADFWGSNLSGSSLVDACLQFSFLEGTDLTDCDLSGADLHGADCRYADLSGCRLIGTNLGGTDLRGVKTNPGTVLRDCDLSGAVFDVGSLFDC